MGTDTPAHALTSIDGGRTTPIPRAGRRLALDQCEQVSCPTCERVNGVATSQFRQVILAPRRRPSGKVYGGKKVLVCDLCGTQAT